MKTITKILAGITLIAMTTVLVSFVQEGKKAWEIPDKYEKMKNPTAGDKEAISFGKSMYAKHCKSCHGNSGKGDGPRSRSLKTPMDDFSSAEFQSLNDGTIYYQSFIGRGEMPNFEKKILDDEDRWSVVSYIRTLKK